MKKLMTTLMLALLMACITVMPSQAGNVKLSKTSVSMQVGQTKTLKVKGTKKKVKWKSSKKSVASVNSKGKITAKKAGTATISAKVAGKTLKCKVKVKTPKLNAESLKLPLKKSYQLKLSNAGYGKVTWTSSDKSIVTVSSKGLVTAKTEKGTAKVKAKYKGKTYTCEVTVISYEDNYAALKEKILSSGLKDEDGNPYIGMRIKISNTSDDFDSLTGVYYLEDSDQFRFDDSIQGGSYTDIDNDGTKEYIYDDITICMYLNILNANTAKITVSCYLGENREHQLGATSEIDATAYENGAEVDFTDVSYTDKFLENYYGEESGVADMTDARKKNEAEGICQQFLDSAISSWDTTLEFVAGYDLSDLGFLKLSSNE